VKKAIALLLVAALVLGASIAAAEVKLIRKPTITP